MSVALAQVPLFSTKWSKASSWGFRLLPVLPLSFQLSLAGWTCKEWRTVLLLGWDSRPGCSCDVTRLFQAVLMRYSDRLQIHTHELACVVFSSCRSTAVEITAPLQCSHVSHLQKLHISYQGTCLSATLNATLHRLFTCSLFFLLVASNHSLIHLLFSSAMLRSDLLHAHKWVRPTLYYKISINEILKQNIWVGMCNMSWGYTLGHIAAFLSSL